MGTVALWHPALVLGLFDVAVTTREGRNEVRAVYGGYGVAMGTLLMYSLTSTVLRPGILVCVAVAMLGMALGRLVSFWADGGPGFYPLLFLGIELAVCAMLFAAYLLAS